ncbi:hypothetical protein CC85DRAFT_288465 [Cutaneotrichosporon oleaginosum]|uniref:Uncharacterized protein n=1 Tax=Cutaneotrichosporon oleaginosum TaxID=879819 RepID=A0A0J1AW32_9TREE|nr:uncharacterized protein CC85DRAFT_288465 [Cutaneotrichosporon oleaginosum]KLT39484.1 hypothetical protein CC85DRAFT_288465 [Cutaneotrichosporon oleaginosum]TXT06851.1 hypothetical protein COLE_06182 [Cutaneotrichosporon oleaginosum]
MDIEPPSVHDKRTSPTNPFPLSPSGSDDGDGLADGDAQVDDLPPATLEAMKRAIDDAPDGDTTAEMLKTLLRDYLSRVPFLRQQIVDQQATIAELQQKLELDKALVDIERDRFISERTGWQAQTDALIRTREAEIAAGSKSKGILDLDVNYHRDLEAANKRLEMDNRLMAPRLVDTQQQIERLVHELRVLRTHVMLQTSAFTEEQEHDEQERRIDQTPTAGTSSATKRTPAQPSKPARMSKAVMGDARAEHLLLAAKKVRSMRQQNKNIGLLTLEELQRKGVVGPDGGLSYSEGYGGLPEEDELLPSDEDDRKPSTSTATPAYHRPSSTAKSTGTPLLPRQKKVKRNAPTTPSRARTAQQAPQTTPGGSNFNDLLLAAEMATRPPTPSRSVPNNMSSARTTSLWEATAMQSPTKKSKRQPPATVEWSTRRHINKEGDGSPNRGEGGSALDLLAQASQDVAQGSSGGGLSSAARLGGAMEGDSRHAYRAHGSRSETPLGPAINLDSRATPSHFPPGHDNPFVGGSPGAFQSPTGAAVPGLGKYVHLSSTVPARRVRSPYLKWTKEEDELLTRAVMEHGEKWDLVSKCVPTRSYHQVRQRWLRKTGAFDKKPATADPSPLGTGPAGEQSSPTPKGRKRKE